MAIHMHAQFMISTWDDQARELRIYVCTYITWLHSYTLHARTASTCTRGTVAIEFTTYYQCTTLCIGHRKQAVCTYITVQTITIYSGLDKKNHWDTQIEVMSTYYNTLIKLQ